MSISSNSVIHFTSQLGYLKGILENGFKVKYCLEENIVRSGTISAGVPMVSFCDIPLSEIKNHISKYGSYAIGLKKEWAIMNNLNPVLYIECNSLIGDSIRDAMMEYTKKDSGTKRTANQKKLLDVARYIKNYQRDLTRNGELYKDYRFYDEREWRYVPDLTNEPIVLSLKAYRDQEKKEKFNTEIGKLKLTFTATDISYIILNDDSEISAFIEFLRKCFKRSPLEDVDTLITRIITVNQIYNDF